MKAEGLRWQLGLLAICRYLGPSIVMPFVPFSEYTWQLQGLCAFIFYSIAR